MKNSITAVTGSFLSDVNAAKCLRAMCRLDILPENILVSGVNSNGLRALALHLLTVHPIGKTMCSFGLWGAAAGAVIAFSISALSPAASFLRILGIFSSFCLGGVLGCMFGTLLGAVAGMGMSYCHVTDGRLAGGKVFISVNLPDDSSDKQKVNAIMKECGGSDITEDIGAKPF
jgi:hypothetical protein